MKRILSACVALLIGATAPSHGATPFPSQPITLVLPFGTGSGLDASARILAKGMSALLGQPVVVDNRAGASGTIAANFVRGATPDGHTLIFGTTNLFSFPRSVLPGRTYDPLADFTPVSGVYRSDLVVIVPAASPINTVGELVATARKRPGKLSYGSYGIATTTHFCIEELKRRTGTSLVHVPYRGAPTMDVVGGQIDVACDVIPPVIPLVKAGKLKVLGVAAPARSSFLPDVATVAEQGFPDFAVFTWAAVMAPQGLPVETQRKLNDAVRRVVQSPEFLAQARNLGFEPWSTSPGELSDFIRAETDKWSRLVTAANIKLD